MVCSVARAVRISLQPATWRLLTTLARDDESPDAVIARVLDEATAQVEALRDRLDRARAATARARADLQASRAAHVETRERLARVRLELEEQERRIVELQNPPEHLTAAQDAGIARARREWELYRARK
jgi:chromosome segregation ATPase